MRYAQVLNGRRCAVCDKPLKSRQTKYCSRTCKYRIHNSVVPQKDRRYARKLELVLAKGGCCSMCGYRKNLAALAFHHVDPSQKDFKLDMVTLSSKNLEAILIELAKCILVCHNCHAELHSPHLDVDTMLQAGRSDR